MGTETNLLRRIYINGDPEKLPEKSGIYPFGWDDGRFIYVENYDKPDLNDEQIKDLLDYDWYEVPVSRDEIIEKAKGVFENHYEDVEPSLTKGEKEMLQEEWDDIAEAITDEIIGG